MKWLNNLQKETSQGKTESNVVIPDFSENQRSHEKQKPSLNKLLPNKLIPDLMKNEDLKKKKDD